METILPDLVYKRRLPSFVKRIKAQPGGHLGTLDQDIGHSLLLRGVPNAPRYFPGTNLSQSPRGGDPEARGHMARPRLPSRHCWPLTGGPSPLTL